MLLVHTSDTARTHVEIDQCDIKDFPLDGRTTHPIITGLSDAVRKDCRSGAILAQFWGV